MHTTTNGSQGSVKFCAYDDRLRIPTNQFAVAVMKNGTVVGYVPRGLAPIFSPFPKRKGVCGDHGGEDESRG